MDANLGAGMEFKCAIADGSLQSGRVRPSTVSFRDRNTSLGAGIELASSSKRGIEPIFQRKIHCRVEISSSLEESLNLVYLKLHQIPSSEGPAQEDPLQKWRCIALALEMAELDCRREAIRKQRSDRGLISYVDNQRAFVVGNSGRLHGVIGAAMQDRICAKAA